VKNNDFRKAFTAVELSDEKKERILQEIYRKKKLQKRKQLMAIAAGILVLLTSFLLLQDFLNWGGQDSRQGEEENGDAIVEDEPDQEKDEEIVEEDPKDDPEDEDIVEDPSEDEDYISFEIPPHPGGMGDELYLVDNLSELDAELENAPNRGIDLGILQEFGVDSLPVFINPVTPGMHIPEQLEEFKDIVREAAGKMGQEIIEEDEHGVTLENGMRLYVRIDLSIDISIDEHPDEITKETLEGKSIEETLEVYQEHFFPMVADLLSYQDPKRSLRHSLFEENLFHSIIKYVEATENPVDQFFQSQLNRAEFRYAMRDYTEGDLLEPPRISIPYYHLEPFEVLGDIPLRSIENIVEEEKGQKFFGQELKIENIVKAEVFYYTFLTGSYLPPVYKLYVQIENPEGIVELDHEDQMLIIPFEVLAVPSEYEREP